MFFEIRNVVYRKPSGDLSAAVSSGVSGYYADDLTELQRAVEEEDHERYGRLVDVDCRRVNPFTVRDFMLSPVFTMLLYPVEEDHQKYRPYNYSDVENIRGRWARYKDRNIEFQVTLIHQDSMEGYIIINNMASDKFLRDCVWLDGTPCGVPLRE